MALLRIGNSIRGVMMRYERALGGSGSDCQAENTSLPFAEIDGCRSRLRRAKVCIDYI